MRCILSVEGIANGIQALAGRSIPALKVLVGDKSVDALRVASVSMAMQELLGE
jgi:hypothetical protein